LLASLLIAACATTAPEATAEERESCLRMERAMGLNSVYDHQQAKGMGIGAMNLIHERCRRILGRAT
jgi:hypothetical protein